MTQKNKIKIKKRKRKSLREKNKFRVVLNFIWKKKRFIKTKRN
jgi:hypothetical protein